MNAAGHVNYGEIRRLISVVMVFLMTSLCQAETSTINIPGGKVDVEISHVGPGGNVISPSQMQATPFGAPSMFSAPLPSGSGARALGLAGAFTAIADDATAASWNPGGLTQLERPEVSVVVRKTSEKNINKSSAADYIPSDDDFGSECMNYFSVVMPFRLMNKNWVCSLNYQEAYDFTKEYRASISQASSRTLKDNIFSTFTETKTEHFKDGIVEVDVASTVTTENASTLKQIIKSSMLTDLDFKQEGVIDAVSPALAVQLTPKVSLGTAVNFFRNSPGSGDRIKSRSAAHYTGSSDSSSEITTDEKTSGVYTYTGVIHWPWPVGDRPVGPTSGTYPAFSRQTTRTESDSLPYDGYYEEINEYRKFNGINTTLGLHGTVSKRLGVGLTVDTPWKADLKHTKTTVNQITTYNANRSKVVSDVKTETSETRSAVFSFPGTYTLGAVWRWNNTLYSALDVGFTQWSDFYYQADGGYKLNPIDGSLYGQNKLDDCFSVRTGTEYLLVLSKTEIPFRAGLLWEQRPAIDKPDEYWGYSLGTGFSIGQDPGKFIIDIAYVCTYGDDVQESLVQGRSGLSSDVEKREIYVSGIWHF